ncbi:hypothetical protein LX32DRAFT_17981 [Colletotrichum zoysiae]|uniref:Uncharacterized protein n=1 Tax=Colletotrichum zoysiae TaxID=1216348 RepID=A0AAD9LXX2_9PEZI|nr:hypothetical protein LX32DRAFT_17981 [Colletotrichum zoysiae]
MASAARLHPPETREGELGIQCIARCCKDNLNICHNNLPFSTPQLRRHTLYYIAFHIHLYIYYTLLLLHLLK